MVLGANEINGVEFPLRAPSITLGEASQMERPYHSCDATGTRVTAGGGWPCTRRGFPVKTSSSPYSRWIGRANRAILPANQLQIVDICGAEH